jgi:hypothetical protein
MAALIFVYIQLFYPNVHKTGQGLSYVGLDFASKSALNYPIYIVGLTYGDGKSHLRDLNVKTR